MQPHINKAYQFLDEHLPYNYTEETIKELKKSKIEVSSEVVRNVRTGKTKSNIAVLNALLKVAKKHKNAAKKLETQYLN